VLISFHENLITLAVSSVAPHDRLNTANLLFMIPYGIGAAIR
jgi:hypothetical protein